MPGAETVYLWRETGILIVLSASEQAGESSSTFQSSNYHGYLYLQDLSRSGRP
jgi:hypothetical protein